MRDIRIGDQLICPVNGVVTVMDTTVCGNVELEVETTGLFIIRSYHYVKSFERIEEDLPIEQVLSWAGIIVAGLLALGVVLL